jgi:tyrosyl-tRNA synthetase
MWRYFELLSFRPQADIDRWHSQIEAGAANPRDVKFALAEEIVARFHGAGTGAASREQFVQQFQKGALPDQIPEADVSSSPEGLPIANLLKEANMVTSTSEAFRMLKQGAVRIDGERVEDRERRFTPGSEHVVQVGKRRYARVRVRALG